MYIHFNKINEVQISRSLITISLVRSEFVHEGSPVFISHLNQRAVEAIVLGLDRHIFRSHLELLAKGAIERKLS
jgi:hypothetical protein